MIWLLIVVLTFGHRPVVGLNFTDEDYDPALPPSVGVTVSYDMRLISVDEVAVAGSVRKKTDFEQSPN